MTVLSFPPSPPFPDDPTSRPGVPVPASRSQRREETACLLARSAATSDDLEVRRLRAQVVRLNMQVAQAVAQRFRGRGIPDEDLDQVAFLGLVKAVHRFDPDRGHDFLSFAVPTIRGEVRRHFRDQGWMVRPPRQVQEVQSRLGAVESDLMQSLGRVPCN